MAFFFQHEKLRPTQEQIMKEIFQVIQQKKHAIIHAPTGMGKTAASLSPALTAALEKKLTILFLTSRHTQHKIVLETVQNIKQKYCVNFNVASFIGKKWMCAQEGASTMPTQDFVEFCRSLREDEKCEYYLNSKSKTKVSVCNDELLQIIPTTENIVTTSMKHKICPYESALHLASNSTIIIADYFYIFNESIRKNFLSKINKNLEDCIVIVDEAHNLPERVRDLMSSILSTNIIQRAIKEAKKYNIEPVILPLIELLHLIQQIGSKLVDEEKKISSQFLVNEIDKIKPLQQFIAELETSADLVRNEQKQSSLGVIASFLKKWPEGEKGFIRYVKKEKENVKIFLQCLDPSIITKPVINQCHSMIIMSGTLLPTIMYQDVLGFQDGTFKQEYSSPFPEKNKLTLIIPKTTTKFTLRSPEQYKNIAEICAQITNEIHGNSLLFFPSYKIRDDVAFFFQEYSNKTILFEQPNLQKKQKEELLKKYSSYKGAVMLCTATGSFGEGIDLPGINKCVIVIGLPLDKPNLRSRELIQYYDELFGKGWDYGYTLPAITKTLQNSGRCIRNEKDKGVLVFLDERYDWPRYKKLFPREWNLISSLNYMKEIQQFVNQNA